MKKRYRYALTRQLRDDSNNFVNFVLLNPSTADDNTNDPTINACIQFAQNWRYDGIYVTNLFAFRATIPAELREAKKPVGELNNYYLKKYAKKSKIVVVAWGNHGNYQKRAEEVIKILSEITTLYCIKILKNGNPGHPLYVNRETNYEIYLQNSSKE